MTTFAHAHKYRIHSRKQEGDVVEDRRGGMVPKEERVYVEERMQRRPRREGGVHSCRQSHDA